MASESPPAFVPSAFGRYQLLDRLAVGGMAEIFRARQSGAHGFEKILVIKRILPHLAADPEFLAMFIDEAKLQCALQHPKIVQVFEFGEVDGQYYIALEYVDGMDALGLLRACAHRRQRLPVRLAVHIASEVLDALDYSHSQRGADGQPLGIVHRDVSPSNVFISRRGDVKLGDFGIARATEKQRQSKTQAGTLKGKYGYMAPEQVIGGDIDGRADLFAVGIVLSEMLMGRRLFTAPNDLDVLLMVRDARLDRLNRYGGDIPPPLRKILDRILSRDPDSRYTTAGALRDVLHEFLFESRQRVTAGDLGLFLDGLRDRQTPSTPEAQRERERTEDSGLILIGEDTRAKQKEAERNRQALKDASKQPAMVARALQIEETGPFIEDASSPKITIEGDLGAGRTPVEDVEPPDLRGELADLSPVRLLARLAADRETGQLIIERGEITKEIFLVDGAPEFVSSNVPAERFGEYLVARGVISAGELSMALAILPRFQGKLGDTLVGLSLLRPLEVFRHLTRQVRDKIIDVFAWQTGRYRYHRGRMNKREAFPLGLDAFEILGAGVAGLPLEPVRLRLEKHAAKRVRRVERQRPSPEHFRVGAGPRELWQRLDGKRTVGEWMRRYDQPEQLLTLCRTLFLLIESDLAALD
ncbi:MAG: serine/threonine protein kinase [Myxococcales bacterium]|nr:serine/threonine protein kinase [Myxococcales bacterium]